MHLHFTLLQVTYFSDHRWLTCLHACRVITALAAVAFMRSLAGFGFPLFAPTMYKALGYGKGNTILAVVAIVVGCPACVRIVTGIPGV